MYRFYLDGILLPIPPEKIQMKIGTNNQTLRLIDNSEINVIKGFGLRQYSFEFYLPRVPYPFSQYEGNFKEAQVYLDKLKSLEERKAPFFFIIMRIMPGGKILHHDSIKVSLENYVVTEDAQEGFDVIVAIELKEYRDYATKKIEKKEDMLIVENIRPTTKEIAKTYEVQKGDCLWTICQKQLGDGKKYKEIARLNNIVNPNLIYPGQVIRFE